MLERTPQFQFDVAQRGDALELLQSLPDGSAAAVIFDPQHRGVLNHLRFGNEGARQRGRAALPAMSDEYIDFCLHEAARVLMPSGYAFYWIDTFNLCMSTHQRVAKALKPVDLIAWDCLRMGMGKRSRRRGDYALILQRPPINAKGWTDHAIPSRWAEKIDRRRHPHVKPTELTARLIAAVTSPGSLVVDPCAGSFIVLEICHLLNRTFIDVDVAWADEKLEGSTR